MSTPHFGEEPREQYPHDYAPTPPPPPADWRHPDANPHAERPTQYMAPIPPLQDWTQEERQRAQGTAPQQASSWEGQPTSAPVPPSAPGYAPQQAPQGYQSMVNPQLGREVDAFLGGKRVVRPWVSRKSRGTALVLSLAGFLGIAGLHRFYAGRPVSGIIWLLTGGLAGIGTAVDALLIASGTFTDKNGDLLTNWDGA